MNVKWSEWHLEETFEVSIEGANRINLRIEIYSDVGASEVLTTYRARVQRFDYFDMTASNVGWNDRLGVLVDDDDLKAVHSMLIVDDMFDGFQVHSPSARDAFDALLKKIKFQFDSSEPE